MVIKCMEDITRNVGTDTRNVDMDTAGGIDMVFVKVREVYDLHTVKSKMTVIGIHTPKPEIIKANFPGLLMQCKAYRPASCDVKIACASTLPLDPQGVGLTEGDVAPEDLFNPILYKACSNFGMSQIEARINLLSHGATANEIEGNMAAVDVDSVTSLTDEFPVYYGLLSNAHGWKTADPQSGLQMTGLKPLVYEILWNVGDTSQLASSSTLGVGNYASPAPDGTKVLQSPVGIRGNAKPLPFINCTSYAGTSVDPGFTRGSPQVRPGNSSTDVPWINCVVGAIIVPPSRLHELFYRMVVEWTIEFSMIRPIGEITNWSGLGQLGDTTHYQNYSFESTKQALGVDADIMDNDTCMVSTNADIEKVM